METFSTRLARFRELKGLNQDAMGKLLGVTGKYVGMLERGDKVVEDDSTISRLLALYESEAQKSAVPSTGARSRLKEARLRKGLGVGELAKAVGYSIATYQEIEDGRSQMGEKMARRVASLLDIDVEDLTNGSDHPPERDALRGTFGAEPGIVMGPGLEGSRAKYVPLLSMAQCGTMAAYDDTAYAHDGFLAIDSKDSKAFAVTLAGDSMSPRFEAGDVAVVYPSHPAKNGDLVIAKLTDEEGADVMFKVYQGNKDMITLSSYNQTYQPMQWPRSAFLWIYPVASVTKLLKR